MLSGVYNRTYMFQGLGLDDLYRDLYLSDVRVNNWTDWTDWILIGLIALTGFWLDDRGDGQVFDLKDQGRPTSLEFSENLPGTYYFSFTSST